MPNKIKKQLVMGWITICAILFGTTPAFCADEMDGVLISEPDEADYSIYFDGLDDYVETGTVSLNADPGFSIELWARRASNGKAVTLISQSMDGGNSMSIGFTSDNYFHFTVNDKVLLSDATYADNLWHHWGCVYVYDPDSETAEWKLYQDGVQIGETTPASAFALDAAMTLGKGGSAENFYHGWMDELRVWSRVLTNGEINYLQKAALSSGYPDLAAYWAFDEALGTMSIEMSGQGAAAILYNMETERTQGIVHKTFGLPLAFTSWLDPSTVGLWYGTIDVNKVCEVHADSDDAVTPTDTPYAFSLPVILHVDASGSVNLLSEVTIMQYPISSEKYGERVLITDQNKLSDYEGVIRRKGRLVGARISSPGFPLEYVNGEMETEHAMTGGVSIGGSVAAALTYASDHPVNPYRHLYHPDADEGYEITRTITMTFDTISEADQINTDPELGVTKLTGVYNESVSGLHKATLYTEGTFTLHWINDVSILNP